MRMYGVALFGKKNERSPCMHVAMKKLAGEFETSLVHCFRSFFFSNTVLPIAEILPIPKFQKLNKLCLLSIKDDIVYRGDN